MIALPFHCYFKQNMMYGTRPHMVTYFECKIKFGRAFWKMKLFAKSEYHEDKINFAMALTRWVIN